MCLTTHAAPPSDASIATSLSQRSMEASQAQLQAFMPKLQQAMADVMREARLTQ